MALRRKLRKLKSKRKLKPGRGSHKGSSFERKMCKALSLWVTGGKSQDVFWRTAMSGGRATVMRRRGVHIRQGGDMCAIAPEGANFVEFWFVEFKHIRDLQISQFLICNTGRLAKFWKKACKEADEHNRQPLIIAKQNNLPTLAITRSITTEMSRFAEPLFASRLRRCSVYQLSELLENKDYYADYCGHIDIGCGHDQ
jgi:hypothetical protein